MRRVLGTVNLEKHPLPGHLVLFVARKQTMLAGYQARMCGR